MAKKRSVKKKKGGRSRRFDPLAVPYRTQRDFNRAVTRTAQAEYRPSLMDLRGQTSEEERKHTTRGKEIESLYNAYGDELQQAYDRTTSALNNLIAMNQSTSQADQAALRAALGTSQGQQNELAQRVGAGAQVPSSQGSSTTLLPAYGTAEANRTALGSTVAAAIAEAAARRSLPALGKIRSSETETRRHGGEQARIREARSGVLAKIPGYREQARRNLLQEAQQTQNLAFQQELAGSQFNLDVRRQAASERQQAHQEQMDYANLQLQQDQLDAQIDQAGTEQEAADAEARSKAFEAGSNYVDKLISPTKQEQGKRKTRKGYYQRVTRGFTLPSQAYQTLVSRYGLSDHDATVILNHVNLPNFKKWVKRHRGGKKKSKSTPGVGPGPGAQGPISP